MPGGDRTGPYGAGPMTGRAMGFCAGYGMPGFMNAGFGRGFGRGFRRGYGIGWGWRRGYGIAPANFYAIRPEDEVSILKSQASAIESELKAINERIAELEKKENK